MNDKKVISNIMWGISAMIGFIITERIYDAGMKAINKEDKENILEIEEIES